MPVLHGLGCGLRGRLAHKRGRFAPSCESPPPGDVRGCPRPQTNLSTFCGKICFAITSRQFRFLPDPGGRSAGDARFASTVFVKATLRPGTDAPLWGGSQSPACRNGKRAADGRRHLLLRAQRVLKGMGMIGKKGKTAGVPLLVRPPRAAALPARDARAHMARRVVMPYGFSSKPSTTFGVTCNTSHNLSSVSTSSLR